MEKNKLIYLDYGAATPVDKDVLQAMEPYFADKFGNAGSIHAYGQEASRALDESREKIASILEVEPEEIIFTSSATESNNLALRGAVKGFSHLGLANREKNTLVTSGKTLTPRVIVLEIEHEAVLSTARDLEEDGVDVVYLPVSKEGVADVKKTRRST